MAKIIANKYIFGILEMISALWHKKYNYLLPDIRFKSNGDFFEFNMPIENRNEKFFVKKGCLKRVELQGIYIETFYDCHSNGHSYVRDEVTICKNDVVIDGGGCEGFFARYAISKGAGKVIIFEPCTELREGLEKTFEREIEENRVVIIPKALGNISKKGHLEIDEDMFCSALIKEYASESKEKSEEVQIDTLDHVARELHLDKIDVIKMDIEGAEMDALKGAKRVIKKYKPKMMIATYHQYSNSIRVKNICLKLRKDYKVKACGCYTFANPFRPYLMLFY